MGHCELYHFDVEMMTVPSWNSLDNQQDQRGILNSAILIQKVSMQRILRISERYLFLPSSSGSLFPGSLISCQWKMKFFHDDKYSYYTLYNISSDEGEGEDEM